MTKIFKKNCIPYDISGFHQKEGEWRGVPGAPGFGKYSKHTVTVAGLLAGAAYKQLYLGIEEKENCLAQFC